MNRKTFNLNSKYFDFSKTKLRTSQDGKKWTCEDKYGIAYILDHIKYRAITLIIDVYSYKELKDMLKEELSKEDYSDVHIYI